DYAWCTILEFLVETIDPEVGRLHHVRVGGNNVMRRHGQSLLTLVKAFSLYRRSGAKGQGSRLPNASSIYLRRESGRAAFPQRAPQVSLGFMGLHSGAVALGTERPDIS